MFSKISQLYPKFSNIQDKKERNVNKAVYFYIILAMALQLSFDITLDRLSLNTNKLNPSMIVVAIFSTLISISIYIVSIKRITNNAISSANIGQMIFSILMLMIVITQSVIISNGKNQNSDRNRITLSFAGLAVAIFLICSSLAHIILFTKQCFDIFSNCHERCDNINGQHSKIKKQAPLATVEPQPENSSIKITEQVPSAAVEETQENRVIESAPVSATSAADSEKNFQFFSAPASTL